MEQTVENKYRRALSACRPKHEHCDDFSLRHPKMPVSQRAKIFSPFSALRGFEEAIENKRKLYVEKRELNEEEQENLNKALLYLRAMTANRRLARRNHVHAAVTCYVPCRDENHEAYGCRGSYEKTEGIVWRVDPLLSGTLLIGEREIELSDISEIRILEEDENVLPLLYGDVSEASPDRGERTALRTVSAQHSEDCQTPDR